MDHDGVGYPESLSLPDLGCDVGLSPFAGLLWERIRGKDSVVAAVRPARTGVFRVGDYQNAYPLSVNHARVVDPAEVPTPGSVSVLLTTIIEDPAVAALDPKGAGDTKGQSALFLISKEKVSFLVVESGFPVDPDARRDTTEAVACVLHADRSGTSLLKIAVPG